MRATSLQNTVTAHALPCLMCTALASVMLRQCRAAAHCGPPCVTLWSLPRGSANSRSWRPTAWALHIGSTL
jgi:hypothetical protein